MSTDTIDRETRRHVVTRLTALVDIKRKLERLYNPGGLHVDPECSIDSDIRLLEDSAFENDKEVVGKIRQMLTNLREYVETLIASPPNSSGTQEAIEKHKVERTD